MKYTLKRGKTRTSVQASKRAQNSKFTSKGKSTKPRQTKSTKPRQTKSTKPRQTKSTKPRQTKSSNSFRLIPQKILSGHPALSKKRKNKRKRYVSRNEVSPFRSVKDHLKDFNSPLAIV